MRRILLVLTLLILPVARSAATDWPMFHLNPRHIGFNRAETVNAGIGGNADDGIVAEGGAA